MDIAIVCADIGSVVKGNFAWYASDDKSGTKPSTLASHAAELLNAGVPVALGFECPLFVPLVQDERMLTCGRPGEGNRAWSAGAGCGALATGLVQVTWVLQQVLGDLKRQAEAYLDWGDFAAAGRGLFLWEAFVSGSQKGNDHCDDASIAVSAFQQALPTPQAVNAVSCEGQVHSLVGAALLRAGWSTDLKLLSQPCLVVKAGRHYADNV